MIMGLIEQFSMPKISENTEKSLPGEFSILDNYLFIPLNNKIQRFLINIWFGLI